MSACDRPTNKPDQPATRYQKHYGKVNEPNTLAIAFVVKDSGGRQPAVVDRYLSAGTVCCATSGANTSTRGPSRLKAAFISRFLPSVFLAPRNWFD